MKAATFHSDVGIGISEGTKTECGGELTKYKSLDELKAQNFSRCTPEDFGIQAGYITIRMTWKTMTMTMTLTELAQLVKEMREAQKLYFRDRSPQLLDHSKRLERELDLTCKVILDRQKVLFDE